MGWFLSGSLIGPAFGPFLGGIIVTYSSWRSIFWLQTALAGTGALGVFFLVPETAHHKKILDYDDYSPKEKTVAILGLINPVRVLRLFRYLNLCLVGGASSALVWNMYSLLTPIRYVLNPRFDLETPLLGGLFYLAPGLGYLLGTFFGGRWADWTVRRWIKKRNGKRVPEDRLRSALPFLGGVIPGCILIYGWSVDKEVGGIPLPVIVLFIQGVGQLFCFPSLNTYCLDALPGRGAEVAAANYCVRYLAGCLGTAVVLPIINAVGVGWFSTISSLLCVISLAGVIIAIRRGNDWAEEALEKERNKGATTKASKQSENELQNHDSKGKQSVSGQRDNEKV
jgi:MFS family permease